MDFPTGEKKESKNLCFNDVPLVVTRFPGLVVRLGLVIYDKSMSITSKDIDTHPIMATLNKEEKNELVHHILHEEERRNRKTEQNFKREIDCIQRTLTDYFKCRNLLLVDVKSKDLVNHFDNLSKLINVAGSQVYFLHIVVFASAYVGHRLLLHNDTQFFDLDEALQTYFGVRRCKPSKAMIHVMWANSRGVLSPVSKMPENTHHKLQIVRIHPTPLGKGVSCIFQIISNFQRFSIFANAKGLKEAAISTMHSFYPGQEVTLSKNEMNPYPSVVFNGNAEMEVDFERVQEGKYVGIGQHWNLVSRDSSFKDCYEQLEYLCENLFRTNGIIMIPTIKIGNALDLDNAMKELGRQVQLRNQIEEESELDGAEEDDNRTKTTVKFNTVVLVITTDSNNNNDAGFSFRPDPLKEEQVFFEYQKIYGSFRSSCPSLEKLILLCNFGHGSSQLKKEIVGRSPSNDLVILSTSNRIAFTYLCEPGQTLGIFESGGSSFACGLVPIFINFLAEDLGIFLGNVVTGELLSLKRVIDRIMKKDINQVHVLHADTKVTEYLFRRNFNVPSLECFLPPFFLDILITFQPPLTKGGISSPLTTFIRPVPHKKLQKKKKRKHSKEYDDDDDKLSLEHFESSLEHYWDMRTIQELQKIVTPPSQIQLETSQILNNLKLLYSGNPLDQVVANGSPHRVTQATINSLSNETWIVDDAIDNYLTILIRSSEKNVHLFSCVITRMILLGDTVNTFSPDAAIFDRDLLLFPLNINNHWLLVVANVNEKKVTCFNSNADPGLDTNACQLIINFLRLNGGDEEIDWVIELPINLPQQLNSNDCGAFLVAFAQYVIQNGNMDFDQRNMLYFRHKVLCTILNQNQDEK